MYHDTSRTEVSKEDVLKALEAYRKLSQKHDEIFKAACDRYVEDHLGKFYTGMLWWKKEVTEYGKILKWDCNMVSGTYNCVWEKLLDLKYLRRGEAKYSSNASLYFGQQLGNSEYGELLSLSKVAKESIFVNSKHAHFISIFS